MITAYNMQYILSKVHDMDDKIMIQRILCRFIESQLKTMPRTIDQDANMKDRFHNLQRLMDKTEKLDKEVCWEKKAYIPTYRRNKKEVAPIEVQSIESGWYSPAGYSTANQSE